ncbi:L-threonylcarbamoyladenylate synthase [Aureimonas mangrovi]|uniref:L-threonylcarbamoyladenylate synthase n=1 Tax=Aureimonas mangrovi TaxID=2758041 RepID=UPI00163D5343|nr:L-threonylcarbamoyladenylate synthase [Aureimonas mangrovi]
MDTRTLSLNDPHAEAEAVRVLAAGGLVALPTETVYGLAGDATRGESVARIFEAKGRPSFNPLIAHVSDREMARRIARFDASAERLADLFWPGPLTLVLPLEEGSPVHPLALAGLSSVAVRMPRGAASDIIAKLGRPLAAPSANASGRVSATSAGEVRRTLGGRIELILDGGLCALGLESTILKVEADGIRLLRPGALTVEEVEAATGAQILAASGGGIEAPGQMSSHYAPSGRVRLGARNVEPGEHFLAFGPQEVPGAGEAAALVNLSEAGDLREAAAGLFAALAGFDDPAIERIAVAPIPERGLGQAINDRLRRAAAPRE